MPPQVKGAQACSLGGRDDVRVDARCGNDRPAGHLVSPRGLPDLAVQQEVRVILLEVVVVVVVLGALGEAEAHLVRTGDAPEVRRSQLVRLDRAPPLDKVPHLFGHRHARRSSGCSRRAERASQRSVNVGLVKVKHRVGAPPRANAAGSGAEVPGEDRADRRGALEPPALHGAAARPRAPRGAMRGTHLLGAHLNAGDPVSRRQRDALGGSRGRDVRVRERSGELEELLWPVEGSKGGEVRGCVREHAQCGVLGLGKGAASGGAAPLPR